eukprot:5601154-Karenia_brevis.AAC.1
MQQKAGGKYCVHSIVGNTGYVSGWSPQRSEGEECFKKALQDLLPRAAIEQIVVFFSDSPKEMMRKHLPSCRGLVEDFVHLPIRID